MVLKISTNSTITLMKSGGIAIISVEQRGQGGMTSAKKNVKIQENLMGSLWFLNDVSDMRSCIKHFIG